MFLGQISTNETILQYGAIGACLLFAIGGIAFLFKYIKHKDEVIEKLHEQYRLQIKSLNENRMDAAVQMTEAISSVHHKLDEHLNTMNNIHDEKSAVCLSCKDTLEKVLRKLNRDEDE